MSRASFIKVFAHHFIEFTDRRAETNSLQRDSGFPVPRASPRSKACSGIARRCSGRTQIGKSAWTYRRRFLGGHGIVAGRTFGTRRNLAQGSGACS